MTLLERQDPGAALAAVLAITVHALLVVVLVFGVHWRTRNPEPVMAELWTELPPVERVRPAPRPEPKPQPKPEPKPEPPPPPPEPKVEPKPAPKPDIALEQEKKKKEEQERQRREEELERQRREEERRAKEEAERRAKEEAERKAREAAARQREEEEEERRRLDAETHERMQEQLNRELAKASPRRPPVNAAPSSDPRARSEWADRIRAKIRGNIVLPGELRGNPEAVFDVQILPSGEVLAARLRKSSGSSSYDAAVERAILKSSPLPLPERREIFEPRLEFKFRPHE